MATPLDRNCPDPSRVSAVGDCPTWRIFGVLSLALILLLLVICKSLPLALAELSPRFAMRLGLSSARAQLYLAAETLAVTDEMPLRERRAIQHKRANALAVEALMAEPLDARGLELLGQIAAEKGFGTSADRLMEAAAKRSLRRRVALYWMAERSFARGDYTEAAHFSDALLRGTRQAMGPIAPVLVHMMESPAAQQAMIALLSDNPPWRTDFFAHVRGLLTNPNAPLHMLLALRTTAHPPSDAEVGYYLRFLIDKRYYGFAYYSWLQLLPADRLSSAGWLYNGGFALPLSGLPFDWSIQSRANAAIDILARDDRPDGHALAIDVGPGRVDFSPVRQTLALPKGRYTLSGLFKGRIHGARGFRWTVDCSERVARVGETQMFIGDTPRWVKFSATLDVPARCRLQTIKLILDARSESETLVSGTAWFTDLAITRD